MTTYTTSMVHTPRISHGRLALAASLALLALALNGPAMAESGSRIDEIKVTAPAPVAPGLRAETLAELRATLVEDSLEAPAATELARERGEEADEVARAEFAAETRRLAESAVRLPTAMRALLLASPIHDPSSEARM
jgi:acyl dehydratase